jgi:hypothetical protein
VVKNDQEIALEETDDKQVTLNNVFQLAKTANENDENSDQSEDSEKDQENPISPQIGDSVFLKTGLEHA